MSQTSVNLYHRVSMDFWELCHFALAEDWPYVIRCFHTRMEICSHPTVWITGSHGLKRDTLLLGRQQDTPGLCICFKEISLSNIFRVCSLEMAKCIGKGDQKSQDLWMVLGLEWADGLKTQLQALLFVTQSSLRALWLPASGLPFWCDFCDIFMLLCKPVEIMTRLGKLFNKRDASNVKFIFDGYT